MVVFNQEHAHQKERGKQALRPNLRTSFQDFPLSCSSLEPVSDVARIQAQNLTLHPLLRVLPLCDCLKLEPEAPRVGTCWLMWLQTCPRLP